MKTRLTGEGHGICKRTMQACAGSFQKVLRSFSRPNNDSVRSVSIGSPVMFAIGLAVNSIVGVFKNCRRSTRLWGSELLAEGLIKIKEPTSWKKMFFFLCTGRSQCSDAMALIFSFFCDQPSKSRAQSAEQVPYLPEVPYSTVANGWHGCWHGCFAARIIIVSTLKSLFAVPFYSNLKAAISIHSRWTWNNLGRYL